MALAAAAEEASILSGVPGSGALLTAEEAQESAQKYAAAYGMKTQSTQSPPPAAAAAAQGAQTGQQGAQTGQQGAQTGQQGAQTETGPGAKDQSAGLGSNGKLPSRGDATQQEGIEEMFAMINIDQAKP